MFTKKSVLEVQREQENEHNCRTEKPDTIIGHIPREFSGSLSPSAVATVDEKPSRICKQLALGPGITVCTTHVYVKPYVCGLPTLVWHMHLTESTVNLINLQQ